jgi:hypothetical protein
MFKIFRYILELHRKNILYERALGDMLLMVKRKNPATPLCYNLDDACLHSLFNEIKKLLEEKSQQPSDKSEDADNGNSCQNRITDPRPITVRIAR